MMASTGDLNTEKANIAGGLDVNNSANLEQSDPWNDSPQADLATVTESPGGEDESLLREKESFIREDGDLSLFLYIL